MQPEEKQLAEQVLAREQERLLASGLLKVRDNHAHGPTLTEIRMEQGWSLGRLARELNLPIPLLDRLERGGVLLHSLPDRLFELLGETLSQTREEVRGLLAASQLAANMRLQEGQAGYLSAQDGTIEEPEPPIRFEEAFMASAPSFQQRDFWSPYLEG
jgi:hypothetical protein